MNIDNDINENQEKEQSDITADELNSSVNYLPDELDGTGIAINDTTNTHLRRLMDVNYLEYASYVIRDRAIPEINDGLKPVQRRILWSLFRLDDGKFHKVANVVGYTMQFHPHGDASIYQALVNIANKEYFIDRQGNFGNVFTGDEAAAARYIEARLTPLAKETLFNNAITLFEDSYDGRNKEPLYLPSKIPSLLMMGQEGIAPGMTTSILPHNFNELLEAEISIIKGEAFTVYPDFIQGGIMDVNSYEDGEGKITLRAKITIEGRKLVIREIPAYTTTEKLIASVEKAVNKNKIKISSISDFTSDKVEIEIIPARGYTPEKTLKALYAYTDCSMSVTSSILVIFENKPRLMTVSEVLRHNTDNLVNYLRCELQLELDRLNEGFHEKTLERIFIENRIYKRIEESETFEMVLSEVRNGLFHFKELLKRDVTTEDIEKLLAIPIRKISRFDINKNLSDIDNILKSIGEVEKNLKNLKNYAVNYIKSLIKKYGSAYPRRTEIEEFEQVDKKSAAVVQIKVGWDKKNCYIGTHVKTDETITCNEYDDLLCIEKNGAYKVISVPQKLYTGKLFYFSKYSKDTVFSIAYKDKKREIYYLKRCKVDKFIRDKEYLIIPDGMQIELITTKDNSIYDCEVELRKKKNITNIKLDFSQVPERSSSAKGFKFTDSKITKFKLIGVAEVENIEEKESENLMESEIQLEIERNLNNESQNVETSESLQNIQPEIIITKKPPIKKNKIIPEKPTVPNKLDTDDSLLENKTEKNKIHDDSEVDADSWGIIQPDLGF